jgi:GNAT superfamily N-acetyltransferase
MNLNIFMEPNKNPKILVREAKPNDWETIAGFQIAMAMETENVRLDEATINPGVLAIFTNPNLGRYFVAESGNKIIASLMVTYEWSDWRNSTVWWLQSVYVLPEFRRKGVFSMMYRFIRQRVEQMPGVSGLRLYMIHHNETAGKAYEKLGMDGNHYRMFEWMK